MLKNYKELKVRQKGGLRIDGLESLFTTTVSHRCWCQGSKMNIGHRTSNIEFEWEK